MNQLNKAKIGIKKTIDIIIDVQRKIKWRQKKNNFKKFFIEILECMNYGIELIKSIFL